MRSIGLCVTSNEDRRIVSRQILVPRSGTKIIRGRNFPHPAPSPQIGRVLWYPSAIRDISNDVDVRGLDASDEADSRHWFQGEAFKPKQRIPDASRQRCLSTSSLPPRVNPNGQPFDGKFGGERGHNAQHCRSG